MNSPKKENSFKSITRGGQMLLHELHMIGQVAYKVMICLLPVGLLVVISCLFLMTEHYQRYLGLQWVNAELYALFNNHHQQFFMLPDGHFIKANSLELTEAPFMQEEITLLGENLK